MEGDSSHNGHGTRRPASRGRAASAPTDHSADRDDLGALLRQLALHVRALFEKAGEYASLGLKRLKLRAADGLFTTLLVVAALLAGATIIVSAARLAVAGMQHAVARFAGAEWIGELGGGLFALALPFLVILVIRWSARRRLLAKALHRDRDAHRDAP
jgi:hypothetical protein